MTKYRIHPYAEIFPVFSDAEFEALLSDIGAHGLREPILLFEGKVLDGVHRLRACTQLNIEPRVRNYTGKDPLSIAISENLKRRHLNESQRAMIAARLVTMRNGGDRRSSSANLRTEKSASEAAKELNVSPRSVVTAKAVLRDAPKQEIKAVESGKKTLHKVAEETKKKKEPETAKPVDKFNRVIPSDMASEWERASQVGKKLQSLAREIKSILSEGFSGAKQDRLKDVIYAEITNSAISDAEALSWLLSSVIPYAVCPSCQGFNRKACALCKKRGWISKFLYNSPAVSKETKAIIERKVS